MAVVFARVLCSSRRWVVGLAVCFGSVACSSAVGPRAAYASSAGVGVSIPVPDPTLGMQQGSLRLQPGWRGTAHIDRTSDPLSYATGTLAADLHSGDGQARILLLAVPFHTWNVRPGVARMMPGNPAAQRNVAIMPFHSTAELLRQHVLPLLQVQGKQVGGWSMPQEAAAQMRSQQQGVPNPIVDAAYAVFQEGGRETLVRGFTTGGGAGTDRESTVTYLTVVSAPAGQAFRTLDAQDGLPAVAPSASWQQANAQYLAQWRQEMEADYARINGQIQQNTQAILAQGQSNIRAMQQRGAERDRAFAQHEQQTSDLGANFRGYLSGEGASFKWCGGGGVTYTVNDTRSPGPGYQRCE